jgi:AP-4 complex subunit epsilon-1
MVTSTEHSTAVLRDSFMLLSTVSTEALRESQLSSIAITSIRHFLSSRDPNDVFLFVSCLSSLDPSIWAGTHPNTAPLLDEWEVQGVMRLLDSPDGLIRKTVIHALNRINKGTDGLYRQTLKILHSVDPTIVETYYSQALHNLSPSHSLSGKNEYVLRLLEIIDMQEANDVDQYARRLRELFSVVEGGEHGPTEDLPVLDHSVERILNGIRESAFHSPYSLGLPDILEGETSSRISCVTALAVSLTEPEVRVGPTIMVVISALVSEYCGKVSISPLEMLRGIATRLAFYARESTHLCEN